MTAAAARPRGVRRAAGAVRTAGSAAFSGDRLFVVAVAFIIGVAVLMASAPMQRLLAGRERLGVLESQVEALNAANAQLTTRAARLQDLSEIELIAREKLGLVKPGEIPFVLVPPDQGYPTVSIPVPVPEAAPADPWYRRLWRTITSPFR